MSINTNLQGRLRNTSLPRGNGLHPLYEAVVNSIHSLAASSQPVDLAEITVEIIRNPQSAFQLEEVKGKRGAPPLEDIIGFKITDNGVGFHDENMVSFETLDSDYKAAIGCRGVGRLLWLKAYRNVEIDSVFQADEKTWKKRIFTFSASQGVGAVTLEAQSADAKPLTRVFLKGFDEAYRERSAKTLKAIAANVLEHCLWYFVRAGGAPKIVIKDGDESINLESLYDEYMFSSASRETIRVKESEFELTHIKLKATSASHHMIAWCADGRVVQEENLAGKVTGLHGKISDEDGDFLYRCYVTSPFLDERVRPERIGFDIQEMTDGLFSSSEVGLSEIRDAVTASAARHLDEYLQKNKQEGRERIERFVSTKAPRYRPILARLPNDQFSVDPTISDKELDLLLHKQLAEIEGSLLSEGHAVMNFKEGDDLADYQKRLASYLEKADAIKQSDLANYVFHRRVVLEILAKAIERGTDGKYAREELIHELIMPMRKTSDEVKLDSCNLWLLDERLAFHDFLASDKPLSSMPITTSSSTKKPDLCVLNVFDEPVLVSDSKKLPLASIVIVEIKRPMRNDAAAGEDKDPVEQSLGYLDRIREGGAQTASGRLIPSSNEIPGFCYAICDITSSIERRCKLLGLTPRSDHSGYFGYNANYKAYIEVISFDGLLNAARERNRAFFDKLGLPSI
jgi:hypothetical protein